MFKQLLSILGIGALSLVASSCGGGSGTTSNLQQPPGNRVPRSGIQHLIIVVMQNASFDHLFGTYSGVNGLDSTAPSYKQVDATGNTVQPALLTNLSPADLNHTRTSYLSAYDSGKMDKYAATNGTMSMDYYDNTSIGTAADGRKFGVNTLWGYAKQYALADNFFAAAMASEPGNMLYMTAANVGTGSDPYGYPQADACTAGLFQQNQSNGATITPPPDVPQRGRSDVGKEHQLGFLSGVVLERAERNVYALRSARESISVFPVNGEWRECPELHNVGTAVDVELWIAAVSYVGAAFAGT